jgi:hypothetical protein
MAPVTIEGLADRAAIESHLLSGERLLWAGRPDPAKVFTGNDLMLIPFSVLWCGFAIFWTATAVTRGAPPFFVLWGAMFVVIGLVFSVGRFGIKAVSKSRTRYGVTTRRFIAVIGTRVSDAPVAGQSVSSVISRDGRHLSVTIGQGVRRLSGQWLAMYGNSGLDFLNRGGGPAVAFYDVADVATLRSAIAEARAGTA